MTSSFDPQPGWTWRTLGSAALLFLLVALGCASDGTDDTQASAGAPSVPSTETQAGPTGDGAALETPADARAPHTAPAPAAGAANSPAGTGASVAPGTQAASGSGKSGAVKPTGAASSGAAQPASADAAPKQSAASGPGTPAPAPATPGGPAPAPAAPARPGSEIRFATLGVGTGPLGAVIRPIPDAARAWVAKVNERGGLNGHPVKLLVGDDGGDPARALALARRFVEEDHILAFFGTHMITTEQVITPYVEQKRIPIIGTCNCSAANDDSPMVFFFGPSASKGLAWSHLAAFVALTDVKKVAFIYCREAAQCEGAAKEGRPIAKAAGLEVVYEAQVSLAAPDYTAEAISARNAGAEAVAIFADNQTAVRFIRSADRQGWKPAVSVQQSGFDERMLSISETEGMYTSAIVPDFFTDPRLAEYREAMKRLPEGVEATIGASTYVIGQLLEKLAPGLSANPTSEDFIALMHGLRGETMGGLFPPITFRPDVPHEDTNRCVIPAVVKNKTFETPSGDKFSCAPGWAPVQL